MVRPPTTTLRTPIVTMAGASKLYLPITVSTTSIMASSVCAAPPKRLSMVTTTKGAGVSFAIFVLSDQASSGTKQM
jgi:hypothetical protein